MSGHEIVTAPGLAPPVGYAHAVVAAAGRTVHLGGQTAQGPDGTIVGSTIAEQFDVAAANVVTVLRATFQMSEDQAHRVMMTAHRRGACVVAVYTKDVAEAKATNATEMARKKGYPLLFTTEPEE